MSRFAELRKLVEEATPGPWGINKYGAIGTGKCFIFGGQVVGAEGFEEDSAGNAAELIVALRNHAPALLDVCEAAEAYVDCWKPGNITPTTEAFDALRAALEKFHAE